VPSTETLEYNGIPYVHTGAVTFDARGGATYKIDARNSVTSAVQYQHVTFDVQGDVYRRYLRGGWAATSTNNYRRRLDERLSLGADYVFVRSQVRDDLDLADTHTIQAALDYTLSSRWQFSGAAGIAVLAATAVTPGQTAPAFHAAVDRNDRGRRLHLAYMQGVLPAFGLGGSQNTKEATVSYFTPLFGSRRFFTDNSASYRDSTPVVPIVDALQLRSLRTFSTIGWAPQRWVRVEGFYTHLSQSSLIAGGRLDRNRIGFQIVTSKPMRID